ncbi:MAG: hypothetical protein GXZ01_07095 [Clostridiaceae bacterium]|nr:hypothetical protein [Clostridiaceae bacterium]
MLILAAVSVLVSTANAKPVFKSDMTFLLEEAVQEFISRGIPVPEELQAKIEWSEAYDLELQKNIEKCENDLKERAKRISELEYKESLPMPTFAPKPGYQPHVNIGIQPTEHADWYWGTPAIRDTYLFTGHIITEFDIYVAGEIKDKENTGFIFHIRKEPYGTNSEHTFTEYPGIVNITLTEYKSDSSIIEFTYDENKTGVIDVKENTITFND